MFEAVISSTRHGVASTVARIATITGIATLSVSLMVSMAATPVSAALEPSAPTTVSGINVTVGSTKGRKAGTTLTDTVRVSPARGRKLVLSRYDSSKKVYVQQSTLTLPQAETSTVTIAYPDIWWQVERSRWQITIAEGQGASAYASEAITVTSRRAYDVPAKYIQIKDTITLKGGGYNLRRGYMGLKVKMVQRKLGMGRRWEQVDAATMARVESFQRKHGLKATGIVNLATWRKLGFSETSWHSAGAYVSPAQVGRDATRKDRIDAMIDRARDYLGDEFVVGASGKPGQGLDCSGLVMQALYAAGMDISPSNPVRHARPAYEYESRMMYANSTMKRVKYSERKRGDLIFYKNGRGVIIHVAIYLGKNRVIDSWPEKVAVRSVTHPRSAKVAGTVLRPFS